MDKKNFIQLFVIHSRAITIESALFQAENAHKAIEEIFPKNGKEKKEGFETSKGNYIKGEKLKWFEGLWGAWNTDISAGGKGGKKLAGDSFLKQIQTREQAETAYLAAMHHAKVERPALEAKGSTPPYLNLWLNDGRWDTEVKQSTEFSEREPKAESHEILELRRQIGETVSIIKQFTEYQDASSDPQKEKLIVQQARERKAALEAKLMQAARNEA